MPRPTACALALLGLTAAAVGAALRFDTARAEPAPPQVSLPQATRGPLRILFSPSGDRAYVAEGDSGTVAVLDGRSGKLLSRFESGGAQPAALAAASDDLLLVANSFSGSVAAVDAKTGKLLRRLRLPGEPSDVVVSRDGTRAFVSLAHLDEVAVVDLPGLSVRGRIPVGRRPKAMALTPDGKTLVVANFQGGDVSLVDAAAQREGRRVRLTGVNLRGVAIAPDGERAYVTGQIAANTRVTAEPLDIWTNTVFAVDLRAGEKAHGAEGWLDFSLAASPDPDGIVALAGDRIAVALAGSDEVLLVHTPGPYLRTYDPAILARTRVGARPRGIALAPDRKRLWVANQLESTLTVLDARTLRPVRKIALGVPEKRDPRLPGRYLFGSASLTRGGQFTCNSCHPDGNTDGVTWEFAHVPDGFAKRNSRNLRGGVTLTSPFRWSGHETEIEEFFQDEIVGLLGGPRQDHETLHALWNMLDQFPMPPNPYRQEDGRLTAAAERGRTLFAGKAGCVSCHGGELHGGTGTKAWIGTTPPDRPVDVPHLHGVHDSPPYLHDGRAATLEEVFRGHNGAQKHGKAHLLSEEELADLLRYVREL